MVGQKLQLSFIHIVYGAHAGSASYAEASDSAEQILSSDVLDDLKQRLEINLKRISRYYASYVRCVQLSLLEKGISVEDLRNFLLSLTAFECNHKDQDSDTKLFSDKKAQLENATKVADIFKVLITECASFLNYEIFESVIDEFDINRDQEKLNYPEHLEAYIKKHKLSEFYEINPLLEKFNDSSKKLILKFGIELTNNLGTLKDCTKAIANILGLSASALRLLSIAEGCVIVTLLIPASLADVIFTSSTEFTPEQRSEFQKLSVMWLECNGYKFKFGNDHGDEGHVRSSGTFHVVHTYVSDEQSMHKSAMLMM